MNTIKNYNHIISILKIFKLIRLDQWTKNTLILLPIIASGEFEKLNILNLISGFLIFSFSTSFIYILNDIKDINLDKKHPTKKKRILASNQISLTHAYIIAFIFFILSLSLSIFFKVWNLIILYYFINFIYNFFLKKLVFLDIICLSIFYVIRIFYGGQLFDIKISIFLTIFSFLIFLILAGIKRLNELKKYNFKYNIYKKKHFSYLSKLLLLSNVISITLMILYLLTDEIKSTVRHPEILSSTVPLIFLWNSIFINNAQKGLLKDNLIKSIFTNIKSIIIMGLTFSIIVFSQI